MRYYWVLIIAIGFGMIFCVFLKKDVDTAVKYFPFDSEVTFVKAETNLDFLSEIAANQYEINWNLFSEVDQPVYLRQDLSLLFVDGRLKGIQGKWQEQLPELKLETSIKGEGSSHYQAISYHHAEVHYPEDIIKSVQKMSIDELYVIDSAYSPLESFQTPENDMQKKWQEALDHATNQQLQLHWRQLIDHFQLVLDDYEYIPLTAINQYQSKPISGLSLEETQRVIAQLWEGLYQQYILPFDSAKSSNQSYVPLVLFAKAGTHLQVLYQDQYGHMQQLIQAYDSPKRS